MKPVRLLVLSLALMGLLAACGSQQADPQAAEPAPEPVPAEEIQADAFAAYLDLSGLSQEALDSALQTIDQESTLEGVTVHVRQTLGDSRSLYVIFDVIYPEAADPAAYFTARLAKGAVTDPSLAEELPGQINSGLNGTQTRENTMSYLAEFDFREPCLTGQAVSLLVEDSVRTYVFTWTAENRGDVLQADLVNQVGNIAGSAALSPFSLTLALPQADYDYDQWSAFSETLQLLDAGGNSLLGPISWQGDKGVFYAQLYTPVDPGAVQTIQAGDCTGAFQ